MFNHVLCTDQRKSSYYNNNNNLLFNPTVLVLPKMMCSNHQQQFNKSNIMLNKISFTEQGFDQDDGEKEWEGFDEDDGEKEWDDVEDYASSKVDTISIRISYPRRPPPIWGTQGGNPFSAGANGLGNKLKLAIENDMLDDSIGIDLVARSVNDLVTCGAKPVHFMAYLHPKIFGAEHLHKIIRGMVIACKQCGCSVYCEKKIADRRGFDPEAEYRLGGDTFGRVKTDSIIDGKNIEPGDVLIGLASSGLHSDGFSLARRVIEQSDSSLYDDLPGEDIDITIDEALMAPTVIYVKQVLDIISKGGVKGIVHIKGGGLAENIARVFPTGLGAVIFNNSWVIPPIFKWIQEVGRVEEVEMRRTFNMGIGLMLVVSKESSTRILAEAHGENVAYRIGEVVRGNGVRSI